MQIMLLKTTRCNSSHLFFYFFLLLVFPHHSKSKQLYRTTNSTNSSSRMKIKKESNFTVNISTFYHSLTVSINLFTSTSYLTFEDYESPLFFQRVTLNVSLFIICMYTNNVFFLFLSDLSAYKTFIFLNLLPFFFIYCFINNN